MCLNANEPLGAEAPPLVGGGGPRKGGGSSGSQHEYAGCEDNTEFNHDLLNNGKKKKLKKNLDIIKV